ncbi:hypothetical protein [Methyloprofundus sp.]|uniref:hypothetical protein n=1 Tax=Methyloprofundus sp. TaxID=2020875 RepID=UPI003D0C295E
MKLTTKILLGILLLSTSMVGIGWLFSIGGMDKVNEWYSGAFPSGKSTTGNTVDSGKQVNNVPTLQLPAVRDESIAEATPVDNTAEAQAVVTKKNTELGLGENSELTIASNSSDEYGNTYYHIGQYYKGTPVYGAASVLEVEQGKAIVISGSWVKNINLDIQPTFDAKTALRKALDVIGVPVNRVVKEFGNAELIVFPNNRGAKLCWLMQATLTNPSSNAEIFIVDANVPEILIRTEAIMQ